MTVSVRSQAWELDRAHVFHSWSAQADLDPMVIERAQGVHVWDDNGRRFIDFSSQLVNTNVGHQHPAVVEAVRQQAARLCTIAPHHANLERSRAASLISGLTPAGHDKVFFTNGGADANENAVRMARLHTGRTKVLSAYRSYHGGTSTAVNLTGDPRRWPNEVGTHGIVHFFTPFLYRSPFHSQSLGEECERALNHLEQVLAFEGPETVAAIVLETVPGTAGIMPPPPGYLAGVRSLCDRFEIVLVLDEVMTGFGRTGSWFAFDAHDVIPDLITFAKGVNSGYVPLGGVILSDAIAATFDRRPYPGGLTYSGHPLACAAAVATIETMKGEGIVHHARSVGADVIGPRLQEIKDRHPSVGDVRGLGVFWAIELVKDRSTREPLVPYGQSGPAMAELLHVLKENGVLPFANFNRVHIVPPCTITESEALEGLQVLDDALTVADRHAASTG